MPTSPKQRQREKAYNATFYNIASSMGLAQPELEKLLAGRAGVGLAKKLGVTRMDLQRFISGEVSLSMAYALGMPQPQAQTLRDYVEREGAVGILIGICAAAPQDYADKWRLFTANELVAFLELSDGNIAALLSVSNGSAYFDDPSPSNPGVSSLVQAMIDQFGLFDFSVMDAQANGATRFHSVGGNGANLKSLAAETVLQPQADAPVRSRKVTEKVTSKLLTYAASLNKVVPTRKAWT